MVMARGLILHPDRSQSLLPKLGYICPYNEHTYLAFSIIIVPTTVDSFTRMHEDRDF